MFESQMLVRIVDYIRRNRVSTTEVADCLGKSGVYAGVSAVNRGHFAAGPVYWVYAIHESNWNVHDMFRFIPEDSIVLVSNEDCGERAIFGELVSKFALLYKRAAALVIDGNMRDAHRLIKENYPIWCRGFNPVGCFNKQTPLLDDAALREFHAKYDGAVAVCDDTGVVIIPPDYITEDFYKKLEAIEAQEDIWADCINHRKWTTYDTICLKKYRQVSVTE